MHLDRPMQHVAICLKNRKLIWYLPTPKNNTGEIINHHTNKLMLTASSTDAVIND